jgi:hypothetical protein
VKLLLPAAVLAALVVIATASAAPPPPQMVGKWTRTVTKLDITLAKANPARVKAGSTWTLVIAQHGATASTPGHTPMKGQLVPSSSSQINIEIGQQKPNLYDWRRSGTKLVLHARADSVHDREAVLNGTWKKRS